MSSGHSAASQVFPLCLTKQWVESPSSQWPQWTESHLIFLVRKFGLCSITQGQILTTSIDSIIQASNLYIDSVGWDFASHDKLWAKMNVKIGSLHANMTGFKDQSFVQQCCVQRERLYIYNKQIGNLVNYPSNQTQTINIQSASSHRPPLIAAPNFAFQSFQSSGRAASQYTPTIKDEALGLWKVLGADGQANLFQSQLQSAKGFNTLVTIMDRYCKTIRARAKGSAWQPTPTTWNESPASQILNTTTPTPIPIKPGQKILQLQANIPPSPSGNRDTSETASSRGGSGSPKVPKFDGLPSPVKITEEGWSASTCFLKAQVKKSNPSGSDNIKDFQEIDRDNLAEKSVDTYIYKKTDATSRKRLDIKAIINNRIRELELRGKREKEYEKMERGDEQERRKRCRIQVII